MKKVLAILFLCIVVSGLAVAGCASRERASPTATYAASGSPTLATPTPTIAPNATAAAAAGLDPALADISGEDDDSLPELNLPTPGAE
jgi:hypothetical protein